MDENLKFLKKFILVIINKFDYIKKDLHPAGLKNLKFIVRKNESVIPLFVNLIFTQFRTKNSDSRLACLLLTNHFFQRSHKFRVEVVNLLQDLLLFTLEIDPLHFPLPSPVSAALALKKSALTIIQCWVEKFALGYPKLQNAKKFLQSSKNFDFATSNVELQVERHRAEQDSLNKEILAKKTYEKVQVLFNCSFDDIQKCLSESHNIFKLLMPKFCDDCETVPSISTSSSNFSSDVLNKLHGYSKDSIINVIILANGIQISKNSDNLDLLNSLKDCRLQMESYFQKISKWLKKLSSVGLSTIANVTKPECSSFFTSSTSVTILLRRIIEVKNNLKKEIKRITELNILNEDKNLILHNKICKEGDTDSDSENDDEFLEVEEKEGFEPNFVSYDVEVIPKHIIKHIEQEDEKNRPGPSGSHSSKPLKLNTAISSSENCVKTIQNFNNKNAIPKLAFGLDLKYWGQEIKPAQVLKNNFDGNSFWRAADNDDNLVTESKESYVSRLITFVGETPVIKKMCRARLPSQKLCPRMDYKKCPIHGLIIDRDLMGFPVSEKHANMSLCLQKKNVQIFDDSDFLRDVESGSGVSLGSSIINLRNVAKKRKKTNNEIIRNRLSAKLFNQQTLKRVADSINEMQKARAQRKFAHQFNYTQK